MTFTTSPAMQRVYDQIDAFSAKWIKIEADRRIQADAIDTARTLLNPKTYNVFSGGTMMGYMSANAMAYNSFRENMVGVQ